MGSKADKLVLTGGAGLVGQNLVALLAREGFSNLVVLDKHERNLEVLCALHPAVRCVLADLSLEGIWTAEFAGAAAVVQLHAQIAGKTSEVFERNTVSATERVLGSMRRHRVPYLVHVSSSVVNSKVCDDYVRSKRKQEALVRESGIPHCVLRPTLMFGWFDPKHLGWLARFIRRTPIFPVPGHGRYMRQPLYCIDFCRAIIRCLEKKPNGRVYDLAGNERVDYIDIISAIREITGSRALIVHIPVRLFDVFLKLAALCLAKPPFTSDQLHALLAGDEFSGVDLLGEFGFAPTPFRKAMEETLTHPKYSRVQLSLPH